mmetsp:Transcript_47712/g.103809  ORF Transcript_47712/g.103809 Transcript_47712/m.103809 type:complete len:267 (+) Transcript_47712:228-1028(+)
MGKRLMATWQLHRRLRFKLIAAPPRTAPWNHARAVAASVVLEEPERKPAPRSRSSARRSRTRLASLWVKRPAKAAAPGATLGSNPCAKGCSLWRSCAVVRISSLLLRRGSSCTSSPPPPPVARRTILRMRSNASLSSRVKILLLLSAPSRRFRGNVRGNPRGPSVRRSWSNAARERASMAATPSSMRSSCRKLPSGAKTMSAMSLVPISSPDWASSCSFTATICSGNGAPPAAAAADRLPFIKFVKVPKPSAMSSMRCMAMRRFPL